MSRYSITTRQLNEDGSRAGADLGERSVAEIDIAKLRAIVEKLLTVAPRCEFPLSPELRVKGETGVFLLKVNHGQVRFDSWGTNMSVLNPSAEFIISTIAGEVDNVVVDSPRAAVSPAHIQKLKVIGLAAAIFVVNGATVWQLTQSTPVPESLVPATTPLPDDLAVETLRRFAGTYATGKGLGDRVLIISTSGEIKWQVLNAKGGVAEEQVLRVTPVVSKGERGLMANNQGLIVQSEGGSAAVYFGDKYRRVDTTNGMK